MQTPPDNAAPDNPRRLRGHQSRSGTTVHGRSAILFGIPFAGVGVFIILAAANIIPTKDSSFHAPRAVVAACGMVFLLPGLWLMLHGVRGVIRKARTRRLLAHDFTQPWLADHAWNPAGDRDRFGRKLVNYGFGLLIVLLLSSPFNYAAFFGGAHKSGWLYGIACVNIFPLIYAIALVHAAMRWTRFGTGRLHYRRFPYALGGRFEADFMPGRRLAGIDKLACTLRCVQEAYETRQVGNKTRTEVVSYELHSQKTEIDVSGTGRAPRETIPVEFTLPDDPALATCLAVQPPRYWELELHADIPGVDYRSVFLLPVYAVGQSRQNDARRSGTPRSASVSEFQSVG